MAVTSEEASGDPGKRVTGVWCSCGLRDCRERFKGHRKANKSGAQEARHGASAPCVYDSWVLGSNYSSNSSGSAKNGVDRGRHVHS